MDRRHSARAGTSDFVADVPAGALGRIAAADFFTSEVWTWHGLVTFYTVCVIDLVSRRVQILDSTPHPDETFTSQIVRNFALADAEGVAS